MFTFYSFSLSHKFLLFFLFLFYIFSKMTLGNTPLLQGGGEGGGIFPSSFLYFGLKTVFIPPPLSKMILFSPLVTVAIL
jgi:hypothetical protein